MAKSAQEIIQSYGTTKFVPYLRGVRGTYLFEIENVGSWFVSVDDGAITYDREKHEADCVIRCNEEDFVDIVEGRRNLLTAALQGRVQVHGDVALAQKVQGLVGTEIEQKREAA
jgi:putative sterol carrier protein